MALDDVATQLQNITNNLASGALKNETERRLVLAQARNLVAQLESPYDKVLATWSQSARDAAVQTCIDLKLFTKWAQAPGDKSYAELAAMTASDPLLMRSLLKHLASMHVISEAGPDTFKATPYSMALARPELAAGITLHFDSSMPAFWKLPSYLAKRGYARPSDVSHPALSDATGFQGGFFEYLLSDPRMMGTFNAGMQGYAADRASWLDIYPFDKEALVGAEEQGPLLVDVGGGKGQDVKKVLAKFPETAGRIVLQDQQSVIDDVQKSDTALSEVACQAHDFFTPQPVQGARIYYFHSVLHDWPHDSAVKILAALKPALRKGYSKVLLNENVVLKQGTDPQITCFDMIMMSLFGSGERTESDFKSLIEEAGLKLARVWTDPVSVESVLECQLP